MKSRVWFRSFALLATLVPWVGCGSTPDADASLELQEGASEEKEVDGGTAELPPIQLPVEVMGPSGTTKTVQFDLTGPVDNITHLSVVCHACGYANDALDGDATKVKAAVIVNGGPQFNLKHYTGRGGKAVGNPDLVLLKPEDAAYGGIGGGFHTNWMVLPIAGLRQGRNRLTFKHVDADTNSVGFRILSFNLLRGPSADSPRVLRPASFTQNLPANWKPADAVSNPTPANVQRAIERGRKLWSQNGLLYDPGVDALDGAMRGGRLSGKIQAACSDCHARDGRDLKYFNYSNDSIIARSRFHGLTVADSRAIAAYVRSLPIPVAPTARPWNPPYQPGRGLDRKPSYQWAAGAGLGAVLDSDADMKAFLFPRGTSPAEVQAVTDRYGKLNMRQLPISLQLPDWNRWLPYVHPMDAFDTTRPVIRQDEEGRAVAAPFYDVLYERARTLKTPLALGDFVSRLGSWVTRGSTCFSQLITNNPIGFRALNGLITQAVKLGPTVAMGIDTPRCAVDREKPELARALELAKQGLHAWAAVKLWEIHHSSDLERRGAQQTKPVCSGGRCVNPSEARGWVTAATKRDLDRMVFTRAPHYLAHDAVGFLHQTGLTGTYDSNAWYHLQLVLNSGYRTNQPSHFPYTLGQIGVLYRASRVSPSFRFWASIIKMRQLQTNGKYGVENGLDLRTAQPHVYYGNGRGDTSMRTGVGRDVWLTLMEKMISDLVADAGNATAADWAAAKNLSRVQPPDSREFSVCDDCWPFEDHTLQGRNIVRLIPRLRNEGVSEQVIGRLITWSEKMWPNGPWAALRNTR